MGQCMSSAPRRGARENAGGVQLGSASTLAGSGSVMKPGRVTEKIISEEKSVRTARIIRNVSIFTRYDFSQARMLGTGISGEVVEAESKLSGRKVAVKTLCTPNLNPRRLEMLLNEVEIYLKLDHPNICKLLEVYEDASAIRLVMELCTGKELYERLAERKRYSERDAARVTRMMLDAIAYCHDHNIAHRDLKLENWVYADASADAQLKLIDFGFSKIFNPGTPMTAIHGTVYYVSPEVLSGSYTQACDIWSIAVICYMLLSGSPPFSGQLDHEIIAKIRKADVSFEGTRWQGISPTAKEFVAHLLVKDPVKRPSAKEAARHPWLVAMAGAARTEAAGAAEGAAAGAAVGASGGDGDGDSVIDVSVLESMRQFAKSNAMRRAALGLIAFSCAPDELDDLEKVFRKIDKENTGTIKLHQLSAVLKKRLNMSEEEARSIFDSIDQTNDNEIQYTEFLAACMQAKLFRHEKYIREAFQRFDLHNTGFISLENLRDVLGDSYHGVDMATILHEVDYKHNGKIDYEEFMRAVLFEGEDKEMAEIPDLVIQRQNSKIFLRKSLLVQAEQKSLTDDANPNADCLATFTWGSGRLRDPKFKLNPKVFDDDFDDPASSASAANPSLSEPSGARSIDRPSSAENALPDFSSNNQLL